MNEISIVPVVYKCTVNVMTKRNIDCDIVDEYWVRVCSFVF